jgi:hypothetical protein
MTAAHEKLFAASYNGHLWWRDAVRNRATWEDIGPAVDVVAIAGSDGILFAVTSDNRLLYRAYAGRGKAWTLIDSTGASNFVAMASAGGKLYAANDENRLCERDAVMDASAKWKVIGHANEVSSMTALGGRLLCYDWDNFLWELKPNSGDTNWRKVAKCVDLATGVALAPVALAAVRKKA